MPETKSELEQLGERVLQEGIALAAKPAADDPAAADIKTLLTAILEAFMNFVETCDFPTFQRLQTQNRPIVNRVAERKMHRSLAAAGVQEPDCCSLAEASVKVVHATPAPQLETAFKQAKGDDWSVWS